MSRVQWREFLSDYWGGLSNLPELVRRISFKKRTLEDELHEVGEQRLGRGCRPHCCHISRLGTVCAAGGRVG